AKRTPSRRVSMAARAACLAALIFSPYIEPEVSMMITSAARTAEPTSTGLFEVTLTTACTSVPPIGRKGFWSISTRNSGSPERSELCGTGTPLFGGYRDDDDGDVVLAARSQGEADVG